MGLSFDEAKRLHSLVDTSEPESRIAAANALIDIFNEETWKQKLGRKPQCKNIATANDLLRTALKIELETDHYLTAATLCWGTELFDSRPRSVRLIWRAMQTHPQLLIYGSGSMGKSYTAICFALLDWERDPEFTTTKLVSTTAGHERAQSFSNLVRLHRMSAVPLSGHIKEGFIGLDKHDKRSSIAEVTIDKGDENKSAKLQGFHPLPRPYPHHKFGKLTRVRGVFDEAEDIAVGLWKGEANMMQNLDDEMHVAIVAMWNPKNKASMAAQKAEPVAGWMNLDERLDEYRSRAGYQCVRLDARKCENVIKRKTVFPGFQTWPGYCRLEEQGGADFDTFGKGIYPQDVAAFGIIDPTLLEKQRGVFIWQRTPQNLATLDMAEEGMDQAIYTAFKYGKTVAFEPEGKPIMYFDRPRWCLQVDQQFPLQKQNTILMGNSAIEMSQALHIKAEWFGLDCTNSVTLRDWLRLKWGKVLGIKWGEAATDVPILAEISEKPTDLYYNIKTEMWFTTGSWVEFGYMAFAPSMDTTELFAELSGMRYKSISKTLKRCEDTKEFKRRFGGKSPDRASSVVMGPHVVRMRTAQIQRPVMDEKAMAERQAAIERGDYEEASIGAGGFTETSDVSDEIEFMV